MLAFRTVTYCTENEETPAGIGTIPHLVGEMLVQQTGINIVHVPYGGGPQSTGALLSGETDMAVDNLTAFGHVRAGKIRPLVVLAKSRVSGAPEVPTAAESGFPGIVVDGWYGLLAPAGLPMNLVRQLRADVAKVLSGDPARKRLEALAFEYTVNTPDEFAREIKIQTAYWGDVFRRAGIRPQQR